MIHFYQYGKNDPDKPGARHTPTQSYYGGHSIPQTNITQEELMEAVDKAGKEGFVVGAFVVQKANTGSVLRRISKVITNVKDVRGFDKPMFLELEIVDNVTYKPVNSTNTVRWHPSELMLVLGINED